MYLVKTKLLLTRYFSTDARLVFLTFPLQDLHHSSLSFPAESRDVTCSKSQMTNKPLKTD